jgi:hypothetical protein
LDEISAIGRVALDKASIHLGVPGVYGRPRQYLSKSFTTNASCAGGMIGCNAPVLPFAELLLLPAWLPQEHKNKAALTTISNCRQMPSNAPSARRMIDPQGLSQSTMA